MWRLLPIILLVSCAVNEHRDADSDGQDSNAYRIVRMLEVPLKPSSEQGSGYPPARVFQHRESSGRIEKDGVWTITGPVTHNRIRCATYETGIQFGKGNPACSHVKWLTGIEYGTRQTHCNSATLIHRGGGKFTDVEGVFGTLTCARAVTRCSGAC